jgi:protein SCO1/2
MLRHFKVSVWLVFLALGISACKEAALPYLGNQQVVNGAVVYHKVGNFSHYNQDSVLMTNDSFKNYVCVVDFFFTSCPSICPKVAREMLKIQEAIKDENGVRLISFSIDPKRDTPERLKLYAENIGADLNKWHFLTGDKDATLDLASTYFVAALEDADAPGGFDHSGKIVLVDRDGHVRAFTEGTDPSGTDDFIDNVRKLKNIVRENDK